MDSLSEVIHRVLKDQTWMRMKVWNEMGDHGWRFVKLITQTVDKESSRPRQQFIKELKSLAELAMTHIVPHSKLRKWFTKTLALGQSASSQEYVSDVIQNFDTAESESNSSETTLGSKKRQRGNTQSGKANQERHSKP
jgi:hypothetical protein